MSVGDGNMSSVEKTPRTLGESAKRPSLFDKVRTPFKKADVNPGPNRSNSIISHALDSTRRTLAGIGDSLPQLQRPVVLARTGRVASPTRPADVPVRRPIDVPKPPVAPQKPDAIKKPVKKGVDRFVPQSLVLRVGLAAGTILGVGGVGYGIYQHTAGAHDEVPSGFTDHLQTFSGNSAPITKLKEIPPGRTILPQTTSAIGDVQSDPALIDTQGKLIGTKLPEVTPIVGKGAMSSSVFNFRLEERPPITRTFKQFTPEHPEGMMVKDTVHVTPGISMQGYVIAKEQAPDGSIFIALGILEHDDKPFENIDKPGATRVDLNDNKIGVASPIVVWLHIPNLPDYQYPLQPFLAWGSADRSRESQTSDPNEIFNYIKVGDPVQAGGYSPPFPNDEKLTVLQQNYQQKKGKVSYEEARQEYLALGNQNVETLQKILADAKTGNVSLRQQFERRRYTIQTRSFSFVVGN